jgi:hypothetical protein
MFYDEKSYGIPSGWCTDEGIFGSLLRANQSITEKDRWKAWRP